MQKLGYPKFTNLMFAIPFSGRPLPPQLLLAFKAMATPMNYNCVMQTLVGVPIGEAREQFATLAVENKCKYLFFWDEDVACPPQAIPELIYKMEHTPDAAAIGGVYCLKRDPTEPLVFQGNGNGPSWDWKAGEFFECSGIGMGCTVLRVEAFKDLKKPWFKTVHDYTRMLDGQSAIESWTEDLWFCQRLADTKKWKVYCDASLLCTHYDLVSGKGYNLPPDSKPVEHMEIAKGKKKVLDIGSAVLPIGHYECKEGTTVRCDYDTFNVDTDYRCNLKKLPFDKESFDIAYSGVLESFRPDEFEEVLKEWLRVVKKKGELRLSVANMDSIINKVIKEPMNYLKHVFDADGINNRKNGFTKEVFKDTFRKIFPNEKEYEIDFVPSDSLHIGIRITKNGG